MPFGLASNRGLATVPVVPVVKIRFSVNFEKPGNTLPGFRIEKSLFSEGNVTRRGRREGQMADDPNLDVNDLDIPFRLTRHGLAVQEWLVDGADTPEQNALLSEADQRHHLWFSIVLSHRQRHPEQLVELRTAVEEILKEGHRLGATLLASPETPLGPYLIQAAKRLGVLVKSVASPSSGVSRPESTPWIDRALIAIPDRVYVLEIRIASKTFELLARRLNDDRFPKGSVFLDTERSIDANRSRSKHEDSKRTAAWDGLLEYGAVFRIRPCGQQHLRLDQTQPAGDRPGKLRRPRSGPASFSPLH